MFTIPHANKRRLCLAFYPRIASARNPEPFHVALLLMNKNPSKTERDTARYHVTNTHNIHNVTLNDWVFRAQYAQRARSMRLGTLLLLGKVSPSVEQYELEMYLQSARVVQRDPTWFCTNWIVDAMGVLTHAGIISPLVGDPERILEVGKTFAHLHPVRHELPVATCGTDGVEIMSELTYSLRTWEQT
ncbi:hypothetical protein K439DRAFT_1413132 [Ramaria rubella]|nr:hypothetical protein K439DRAFT_1413132 [Ramaria rubella]